MKTGKATKKDVSNILKKYNLGSAEKISVVKGGIVNYNFDVKTDKGRFIVRFLNDKLDDDKKKMLNLKFKVLAYLKKENFPYRTPTPIKNKDGKFLTTIRGKTAWIYERIEGLSISKANSAQIKEIIKALATYNKFVGRKDWGKKFRDYAWLRDKYSEMRKAKIRKPIDKLMLDNVDFFEDTLNRALKRPVSNIIPIHSDMHHGNVLFKGNKIVAILDFGNLKLAPKAMDVAYLIRQFGRDGNNLNKRKMNNILKEYRKFNRLTKKEESEMINLMMKYNCIVFWWFYSEMKQELDKREIWLKNTIEMNKNLERVRK